MDMAIAEPEDDRAAAPECWGDRVPEPDELKGHLAGFGSSEDRRFEHHVFKLVNHYANPRVGRAAELDRALETILESSGVTSGRRPAKGDDPALYAALYGRCMLARRGRDLPTYRGLLATHRHWAGKKPETEEERASFFHLQAMMHALEHDPDALKRAVDCARKALEGLRDHVGVQHHYAELVAVAVEQGAFSREEEEARLLEARSLAQKAAGSEDGYAKFHATLGRLKGLGQNPAFEGARGDLLTAIEKEKGSYDSEARRTDYKIMLADITQRRRLREQERALEARVKEAKDQIQQAADAVEEVRRSSQEHAQEFRNTLAEVVKGVRQEFRTALDKDVKAMRETVEQMRRSAEETKTRHAEMLGFFAGVLALILTGLDAKGGGGGGASAPEDTAALLLMLAGVLLVSFSALSYMMRDPGGQPGTDEHARAAASGRRVAGGALMGILLVLLSVMVMTMPRPLVGAGGGAQGAGAAARAKTAEPSS